MSRTANEGTGIDRALLDEQIAYYRARATEYEEWFFRRGRYSCSSASGARMSPRALRSFWETVRAALAPGGSVFFVDNTRSPTILARGHRLPEDGFVRDRVLNDGRRFRVVKVYYEPEALERALAELGWAGHVRSTGAFLMYERVEPG